MHALISQDKRNRATWSRASSRRWLDTVSDFTDAGERAALCAARIEIEGKPILDLGVGTGRTIPLLAPFTRDYRGVDYLSSMVAACRSRHPDVRVELGDARALTGMPGGHFGLVCFSFNGVDAVAHEDRRKVLCEMRRVLRDDGVAVFSTLNIDGPAFRARPWRVDIAGSHYMLLRALRTARAWTAMPVDLVRWAELRRRGQLGEGWAVAPLSAHHYGVLAHFTTLHRQLSELGEVGLDRDVAVLDSESGRRLGAGDDTSSTRWFHIITHVR